MADWWDGAPETQQATGADDNWWAGAASEEQVLKDAAVRSRIDEARAELGPTTVAREKASWIPRHSIPVFSSFVPLAQEETLKAARERIGAGKGLKQDYMALAEDELHRETMQAADGPAMRFALGLAAVPRIVGEAALLGGGGAVGETAKRGLLAAGAEYAGSKALHTAAMPSMYIPEAVERARTQGGEWYEPQNLGPAYAHGYLMNLVLGSAGRGTREIPNAALRFGASVGVGMAEMQATDIGTSLLDDTILPEAYRINARYGMMGSAYRKDYAGLAERATIEAATFAAFTALHGNPGLTKGELAAREQANQFAKEQMKAYEAKLKEMADRGVPAEERGKRLLYPYEVMRDLVARNPNPTREQAVAAMDGITDPDAHEWGLALAGTLRSSQTPPTARESMEQAEPTQKAIRKATSADRMVRRIMGGDDPQRVLAPIKKDSPLYKEVLQRVERANWWKALQERPPEPPGSPPGPPEPQPAGGPPEPGIGPQATPQEPGWHGYETFPVPPGTRPAFPGQAPAAEMAPQSAPPMIAPNEALSGIRTGAVEVPEPPVSAEVAVPPQAPVLPPPTEQGVQSPVPPERPLSPLERLRAKKQQEIKAKPQNLKPQSQPQPEPSPQPQGPQLTPAEQQVIDLREQGLTMPQIAEQRGTSPQAVDKLERKARAKLAGQPWTSAEEAAQAIEQRQSVAHQQVEDILKRNEARQGRGDVELAPRGNREDVSPDALEAAADERYNGITQSLSHEERSLAAVEKELAEAGENLSPERRQHLLERLMLEQEYQQEVEDAGGRLQPKRQIAWNRRFAAFEAAANRPAAEAEGDPGRPPEPTPPQQAPPEATPVQRLNALHDDYRNPSRTRADIEAAVSEITKGMKADPVVALAKEFGISKPGGKTSSLKKIVDRIYDRQDVASGKGTVAATEHPYSVAVPEETRQMASEIIKQGGVWERDQLREVLSEFFSTDQVKELTKDKPGLARKTAPKAMGASVRGSQAQAATGEWKYQVREAVRQQLLPIGESGAMEVVNAVEEGRMSKEDALRQLQQAGGSSAELASQIIRYGREAVLEGRTPESSGATEQGNQSPVHEVEPGVFFAGLPVPKGVQQFTDRVAEWLFTRRKAGEEVPTNTGNKLLPRFDWAAEKHNASIPRGAGGWFGIGKALDPRATAEHPVDQAILGRASLHSKGKAVAALWAQTEQARGNLFPQEASPGEGSTIALTDGSRGYLSDVIEAEMARPGSQKITPRQRDWIRNTWTPLLRDAQAMMKEAGVANYVDENGDAYPATGNYFPRRAIGKQGVEAPSGPGQPPGGPTRPGSKVFFQKGRHHGSEREGATGGEKVVYDPSYVSRAAKFLEGAYKAVADHHLANDPALEAEPAKEQVWLKKEPVNVAPAFQGKVFPRETAQKLTKAYGDAIPEWMQTVDKANAALKGAVLAGDTSVLFVQLAPMMFRHPARWAKTAYNFLGSFADGGHMGRYLSAPENQRAARELVEHGSSIGRLQDQVVGLEKGDLATKVPVVGGVLERFGRGFGAAIDTAKIELWKAWSPNTPNQSRAALAEAIDNAVGSGRMEQIGLAPSRAMLERFVLLAPSYYRGQLGFVADAFAKGMPGRMSRQMLGSFALGTVGTALLGMKLAGLDNDEMLRRMNPASGKFLKVPVPLADGTRVEVGFGNMLTSLVRLAGDTIEWANSDEPLNTRGESNPVLRWLRGHGGMTPRMALDLYEKAPTEAAARNVMPLLAQQLTMEKGSRQQRAADAAFTFLGFNAFEESPNAPYVRALYDEAKKTGKRYQDLSIQEQARVIRQAQKGGAVKPDTDSPEMVRRAIDAQAERKAALNRRLAPQTRDVLSNVGATIPGYQKTVRVDGVDVPLTDSHAALYQQLLVEEYDREVARWGERMGRIKELRPDAREEWISDRLSDARSRAKLRLIRETAQKSKKAG